MNLRSSRVNQSNHDTATMALGWLQLPGMDGPELVRRLRQLDQRLPMLGMTGLTERATTGLEGLGHAALLPKLYPGGESPGRVARGPGRIPSARHIKSAIPPPGFDDLNRENTKHQSSNRDS